MDETTKYDVFLSHSSGDKPAVELLARRLREKSGLNPFLDKWHLVPGTPWQRELEQALNRSACAAIFFGPASEGPWRNEELQVALMRAVRTHDDYRVIPVLLPDANPEEVNDFLSLRTWVDFKAGLDDSEAYDRLVAGIRGEPIEVGAYALPDEPAPYRGLLSFDKEHAEFFFGREAETQRLIEKLSRSPLVAVVGASGSGKSSLVLAGLLPRLERNVVPGSRDWRPLVVRPGSNPLRSLAEAVASLGPPEGLLRRADELTERFLARPDGLRTAVSTLTAGTGGMTLLVIDQFEELFTHGYDASEEKRTAVVQFAENLYDAATKGDDRLRFAITLRADFVGHCLELPRLGELLEDSQVLLGALSEENLREAILLPAKRVGAFIEKGLVHLLVRDVAGQPSVLPLLQHALFELWLARRGPWLTLDAYESTNGIAGALHRRAQGIYERLSVDQKRIARHIFLRLVSVADAAVETRRRARRAELYISNFRRSEVDAVLAILSGPEARLIVADENVVEVAHEALLQRWTTLRSWIDESREDLLVNRRLSARAAEWEGQKRNEALCYDEVHLTEVRRSWAALRESLSSVERDFVRASWETFMRARRTRVFWSAVLLSAGLAINALLVGMVFSEGPGVAAMHLVPPPLGFGLGGLLVQRKVRSVFAEYAGAVFGALLLEGALVFFFQAIWPSL